MDEDNSYWDKPNPEYTNSGDISTSGSTGTIRCPDCGSYNTIDAVYVTMCNSCGWGVGY